ncbi:unnamed protein product [Didymodactylos carnosus]|uniref:Carbohydrate kinase PfkB domain-containing protein n=1 Tax=Didymodactylos carnosus TaxID=1234261 RepID=A0A814QAX5_9BILA|nr:unnamed protein product [Didymodactylos carnosus]CAF1116261.1 unnamed protein product [Didymodactylos carnosus]CAF3832956.1 unnamed protein product [Didymodactylos carnosus]CAF3880132.1 unnamed protein product [Didymodactylos carnosus]
MTDRTGLLASGTLLVDYITVIDHFPAESSLASILSESTTGGGGSFNILKDLSAMKVNFPLSICGLVGDDENGKWLIDDCKQSHIDVSQLHVSNVAPTSYTYVMSVEKTGRRTFFNQRGTNALLNENHFNFTKTNAKFFYLGYLTLLDQLDAFSSDDPTRTVASKLLECALNSGLETIIDFVSASNTNYSKIAISSMPYVDHLILNETEAGFIVGRSLSDLKTIQYAAKELLNYGVRKTVTIHFDDGAVTAVKNDDNLYVQGSIILPDGFIKGAVGAGDAFAAGIIFGTHEQWSIKDRLRLAVCAAAACLNDSTPCAGVRTVAECLELEKFGYRTLEN